MKDGKLMLFFFIVVCFISGIAINVYSDPRIDEIRRIYKMVTDMENSGNDFFQHRVVLNTMVAAIGLQTTTINFIYSSEQKNPEIDPYILQHYLYKVVIEYNIADALDYHIEYLFDKEGNPIFYFRKKIPSYDEDNGEKRLYFYNKNLIRVIMNYADDTGKKNKYTAIKDFSAEDNQLAKYTIQKAMDYAGLFELLISAEAWDK